MAEFPFAVADADRIELSPSLQYRLPAAVIKVGLQTHCLQAFKCE